MISLGLGLPRARMLGDAMLAPADAAVTAGGVREVRERLLRELSALAGHLPEGERLQLDPYRVGLLLDRPEQAGVAGEPFVDSPATCRRAIGLLAVDRCVRGRSATPAESVSTVLEIASAPVSRDGVTPLWWARWYGELPPGAQAVVRAEATTWATQLCSALDWRGLEGRPVVGGRQDWWDCPGVRQITLRGRVDVRLPVAGRQVLLAVGGSMPPSRWRIWLGLSALAATLVRGEAGAPIRVVGLWPASGQVRILPVGDEMLGEVADAVISVASAVAQARSTGGQPVLTV